MNMNVYCILSYPQFILIVQLPGPTTSSCICILQQGALKRHKLWWLFNLHRNVKRASRPEVLQTHEILICIHLYIVKAASVCSVKVKLLAKHMTEANLKPTQRSKLVMLKTFLQEFRCGSICVFPQFLPRFSVGFFFLYEHCISKTVLIASFLYFVDFRYFCIVLFTGGLP